MSKHYKVPADKWLDLSTLSGVAPGTPCRLVNVGLVALYVVSASAEPDTFPVGLPLTTTEQPYAVMDADSSAETIWVRAVGKDGKITIQEA